MSNNLETPTFSIDFHGGHGEPFPLAKLAELMVGTDWCWVRNNIAKHLVVFIDTRDNRLCRAYDRDHRAMTFDELARQHGKETVGPDTFEASDLHRGVPLCIADSYALLCRELTRKQGMVDDLKEIAAHHGLEREDELSLIQAVKDRDNMRQALAALRLLFG